MTSTERGQRGVGRLRLSATATSPLSMSPLRGQGGLASPIAVTASTNHGVGKQVTPAQQRFDVTDFESSSNQQKASVTETELTRPMRAALAREMRVFPKTIEIAVATLRSPTPIGAALNAAASSSGTRGCADDALAASRLLAIHNVANDLRYQYSRGTLYSYMRTAMLSRPVATRVGRGGAPPPSTPTSTVVGKPPAQVAFTITRGTRQQLGTLGFAEEDIRSLKPAEAIALVQNSIHVDDSRQWLAAAAEAESAEAATHLEGRGNVAMQEEEEEEEGTSAKFDMSLEIQKLRASLREGGGAHQSTSRELVLLQPDAEKKG
eukprot:CAMPEP_0119477330 /NCGR_PEP_ID=MMETSP1344-20130328/7508_1 /TAXON_ID=236787 /ORGANISM="Florenciella parvula, Strain CCMP2471" /LENGTH=320 /DNA_ID=CAMNT_0007511291 /DNA_START=954 /DNA_END=1918 /DNA_ORIENTATION=+